MKESIQVMKQEICSILSMNQPSIYLFGSIVLDDFKLGWSDIDILCLTKTSINIGQAEQLVILRQKLLDMYPSNLYYRSFEGGILALDDFLSNAPNQVVYWGTSGQRITDQYVFDTFSRMELLDSGILITGDDIRDKIKYPLDEEIRTAVISHYETIRKFAVSPSRNLYSVGWLLDIARCLYTLQTGKIIAKTKAGEWAIEQKLAPNVSLMEKAVEIRKNPMKYKNDEGILDWMETLGPYIQEFANVLEKQIYESATNL
ncbi:MAG: polymerase beta domain protein region [Anaerocolumna sp.]|jgi:predicted nucleotidyltransferase|nr:polymerase beta domain protein region [Anaerocolumna sp.]